MPASIYACFAQEQVAAVLIAFLLLLCYKARKAALPVKKILFIQTALSLIAFAAFFCLTLFGPRSFLLEGLKITFSQRIFVSLQWLVHSYVVYAKYVLFLIWAILFPRFIRKKQPVYAVVCAVFSAMVILSIFLPAASDVGLNFTGSNTSLSDIWNYRSELAWNPPKFEDLSALQLCTLFYWLFSLAFTPWMLLKAKTEKPGRFVAPLIYLAGTACACIVTISGWMYISEGNTFFLTSVLLVLTAAKTNHMILALFGLLSLAAVSLYETYTSAADLISQALPYIFY